MSQPYLKYLTTHLMRLHYAAITAFCWSVLSSGAHAQAVQATRSLGRIHEGAIADSIARVVGQLVARASRFQGTRMFAHLLGPEGVPLASQIEPVERLALAAIEKRDSPREFARAVDAYNEAVRETLDTTRFAALRDTGSKRLMTYMQTMDLSVTGMPTSIGKYVPDVLFSIGGVAVDRSSGSGNRSVAVSVSTNLVGQIGGAIVSAVGAGGLADYLKDNVVMGVSLNPGKTGKPSGELTAGLGELKAWVWTFWPILGFEQTDTADARIPSSLEASHPTVGTWTSPVLATAFTWMPLTDLVRKIQNQSVVPIMTVGVRFPFYFPGKTTDALGALFGNKISDYARDGKAQFLVAIDIPLLKVDPARLTKK